MSGLSKKNKHEVLCLREDAKMMNLGMENSMENLQSGYSF